MDARITEVVERPLGSALAAPALAGDHLVVVAETADFDDAGTLQVEAEVVAYTSSDPETGIITLATGLATGHGMDVPVQVYPASVERWAGLIGSDNPDGEAGMVARIPHALYDRLPVGIRSGELGESVQADFNLDELVVTDVTGEVPLVDGSYIDPATLPTPPPAPTSDGLPPAVSPAPTVVPGLGELFVRWTAIVNHDPVTYAVHASTVSGFVPGPTTLAGTTGGTQAVLRVMPDGTPLDYTTTYYVALVASDVDGSAAASVQASGTPVQVTGNDVAADSITADEIVVDSVLAAEIASLLLISGTIETAASGQRVVIDDTGIHLYDASGAELVSIPTDPKLSPTFRGNVVTGGLTVTDQMLMQGAQNQMDRGAVLTLTEKQANPTQPPGVSIGYDYGLRANLAGLTRADPYVGAKGAHYDAAGGAAGTTPSYLVLAEQVSSANRKTLTLVEFRASDGVITRQLELANRATASWANAIGVTRIGSSIYALYYDQSSGGNLQLAKVTQATMALVNTTLVPPSNTLDPDDQGVDGVGVGTDGTSLLLASHDFATNRPTITKYTVTGATPTLASTLVFPAGGGSVVFHNPGHANNPGGANAEPIGVLGVGYDGTNYYVLFLYSTNAGHTETGQFLQMYVASTGVVVAHQEIYYQTAYGYHHRGVLRGPVGWELLGVDGFPFTRKLTELLIDTSGGQTSLYFAYRWEDATPSVTVLSPIVALDITSGIASAPLQRTRIQVTVPARPAAITKTTVFALTGSATPAATALRQMQLSTGRVDTETASPVTLLTYGTGPTTANTNTFPGAVASVIQATGSGIARPWLLGGGGKLRVPSVTPGQQLSYSVAGPEAGDLLFDPSVGTEAAFIHDGHTFRSMPRAWWANGGEGLRDALFAMAGVYKTLKAQNFPLWGMNQQTGTGMNPSNNRATYLAIYWPGGPCNGFAWLQLTQGVYTDTGAVSGMQLMGGTAGGPIVAGNTLLVPVTGTKVTANNFWKAALGFTTKTFTAFPLTLPAGIYYVNLIYSQTAVTTGPEIGGLDVGQGGLHWMNDNDVGSPTGYFMAGNIDGAGALAPGNIAISSMGLTRSLVPWVGLIGNAA